MDSLLLRPLSSCPRPRLLSSPSLRGDCSHARYSVRQELSTVDRCRFGRIQGCLNSSRTSVNSVRLRKSSHVKATSGHSLEMEPDDYTSASKGGAVLDPLHALYKFSRPHTVIGTALSIVSVSLLAVENFSDISPLFFAGMLEAVAAAFFMNIYIVGLNQLFDIEIDKVNKPDLPLASGEYSIREGITIIAASAVMSFGIGWIVGSWPLFWALFISFILGTAYSINNGKENGKPGFM